MKRSIFLIVLLSLIFFDVKAQNVDINDSNVYCAVKKDGKWGFIDKTGKTVIPFKLEATYSFREGLAAVKFDGKWGFIDSKGRFVLRPVFESAHNFYNGRALVSFYDTRTKITTFGYINMKGDMILPLSDNEEGFDFHDGLARVKLDQGGDQTYGYADTLGQWKIPFNFELAQDFSEGSAPVFYNNKWGFIDEKNHVVIGAQFDDAYGFHEDRAYVQFGNKSTFIDKQGIPVLPSLMNDIDIKYQEGMAAIRQDGKMGFMDLSGNIIIKPQFDNKFFSHFSEGLAMIMMKDAKGNEKWGFCDKTGKVVIPAEFELVRDFKYGMAVAVKNGKYGLINRKGEWIIKPIYEDAVGFTPYYY